MPLEQQSHTSYDARMKITWKQRNMCYPSFVWSANNDNFKLTIIQMHEKDYHCRTSRKYSLSEANVQQCNKDKKMPALVLPDYRTPHYLHTRITSLLLDHDIPPSTQFSYTFSPCSSLKVRDQVAEPYETGNVNTSLTKTLHKNLRYMRMQFCI